jgi:hypothetical protein
MSDRLVVETQQDAERINTAAETLARVLLRDDPRVQRAYQAWQARSASDAAAGVASDAGQVWRALYVDLMHHLAPLVAELGLARYRWLPLEIFLTFCRASGVPVETRVPPVWPVRGRAPKRGPVHTEDLDRYCTWFYRVRVLQQSARSVAKDAGHHRSNVQHAVKRLETWLDAID